MNMRKKKLLALMVTSAIMTCPVWAEDTTATTGYESVDYRNGYDFRFGGKH